MFAKPIPVYQGFSEESASEVRGAEAGRRLDTANGDHITPAPRMCGDSQIARGRPGPVGPGPVDPAVGRQGQGTSPGQRAIACPTALAPPTLRGTTPAVPRPPGGHAEVGLGRQA
jgi:hypothetical protein